MSFVDVIHFSMLPDSRLTCQYPTPVAAVGRVWFMVVNDIK